LLFSENKFRRILASVLRFYYLCTINKTNKYIIIVTEKFLSFLRDRQRSLANEINLIKEDFFDNLYVSIVTNLERIYIKQNLYYLYDRFSYVSENTPKKEVESMISYLKETYTKELMSGNLISHSTSDIRNIISIWEYELKPKLIRELDILLKHL
jgi:hypothetical protein